MELVEMFKQLEIARQNVSKLLEEGKADTLIDMHDIVYWAGEVRRLRAEIRDRL